MNRHVYARIQRELRGEEPIKRDCRDDKKTYSDMTGIWRGDEANLDRDGRLRQGWLTGRVGAWQR